MMSLTHTAFFTIYLLFTALVTAYPSSAFVSRALITHNKYRIRHGVRTLKWDQALADHAQNWADGCYYHHSDDRRPYDGNCGENISYGFPNMTAVIEDWYETEVDHYDFDTGRSIGGVDILHLTQMLWKETTHVGCAETYCENLKGYLSVCNYHPSGNWARAYVQNVKPVVAEQ